MPLESILSIIESLPAPKIDALSTRKATQPHLEMIDLHAAITTEHLSAKRAELRAKGINLRAFCDQHGVSYQAARDLLRGQLKGHRGDAHRAAVALGLKSDPEKLAA